jgi:putative endonuclease
VTRLTRQALGRRGEDAAVAFLTEKGYRIEVRNWRPTGRIPRDVRGELDIVARDGETWVFVEVRARRGQACGTPEESITSRKARQLVALAWAYVQAHALEAADWRIDVVALTIALDGRVLHTNHIQHAVTGVDYV